MHFIVIKSHHLYGNEGKSIKVSCFKRAADGGKAVASPLRKTLPSLRKNALHGSVEPPFIALRCK